MSDNGGIPLSVVVPVREGLAEVAELLEAMLPGARAVGAEVVVVGDLDPQERSPDKCVLLEHVSSKDNYQDHGAFWSIRNAFHSARSAYGYERQRLPARQRRRVARWALANIPSRQREEARGGSAGQDLPRSERALIAALGYGHALGAVAGVLVGAGRSPDRLA